MRIVIISDTHGRHEDLGILEGDVLIHCGDACDGFKRDPRDVDRLDSWFGLQRFDRILCIGGNHDFAFEEREADELPVLHNAVFLKDAQFEYNGIRFYGSPWTPELIGWAYYLGPKRAESVWSRIPEGIHVLITHTPPAGVLDTNRAGRECGCTHLAHRVERVRPLLHCFGHVHASAGTERLGQVLYINASMVNSQYQIAHSPVVYDLDPAKMLQPPRRLTRHWS